MKILYFCRKIMLEASRFICIYVYKTRPGGALKELKYLHCRAGWHCKPTECLLFVTHIFICHKETPWGHNTDLLIIPDLTFTCTGAHSRICHQLLPTVSPTKPETPHHGIQPAMVCKSRSSKHLPAHNNLFELHLKHKLTYFCVLCKILSRHHKVFLFFHTARH